MSAGSNKYTVKTALVFHPRFICLFLVLLQLKSIILYICSFILDMDFPFFYYCLWVIVVSLKFNTLKQKKNNNTVLGLMNI